MCAKALPPHRQSAVPDRRSGDAAATGQLLPSTLEWIAQASALLRHQRTEVSGPSGIAAMEISENVAGDQRAVHMDLHAGGDATRYQMLAGGLVGLSAHAADARDVTVLAGTPIIRDELQAGQRRLGLERNVRAFFQGNRYLLQPLVDRVLSLVDRGPIVDLYGGVGLFGLSLAADGAAHVTVVEGDPISSEDLARNAAPFGDRVNVQRRSVETFLAGAATHLRRTNPTVIVDPPRTGMTREALAGIINAEPARIVYVSCDVATLARDARTLVDAGWELTALTGIDLFPNTAHVESIAVFSRERG